MPDQQWRAEADDEWLEERRSSLMGWFRRHFKAFGGIASAVSHADTGPYAGAPRNPKLKIDDDDKAYATVRYTTNEVAYTATSTSVDQCASCGQPLAETHEIQCRQGEETHTRIGSVRTCSNCEAESWLRRSHMPKVAQARDKARKNVV
ncbi:hypothetical protein [Micromonospora sp. CNB394]|uniref:hypothetical protein n=1 Tax=Micromonospora sp. CNB394 TaxID=1169151 RepID=UPI0003654A09|nr:hypothetical protein [Micromonospora sp. CNB394]